MLQALGRPTNSNPTLADKAYRYKYGYYYTDNNTDTRYKFDINTWYIVGTLHGILLKPSLIRFFYDYPLRKRGLLD